MLIAAVWSLQVTVLFVGGMRQAAWQGEGLPRSLRMLLSASLVAAAYLVYVNAGAQTAAYARAACLGMLLSFVGDLLMAKLIPFPNRLVGGMLAFGAAHWMYIRGYRAQIEAGGASFPFPLAGVAVGAYAVFSAVAWQLWIRNPEKPAAVNIGALLYGTWIAVMAGCALTLAATLGGAWWLSALGGAVFVVSDLLIGLTAIGRRAVRNEQLWIWLTYILAQMGIIYAPWLAGG